jgi:hypothetical protein
MDTVIEIKAVRSICACFAGLFCDKRLLAVKEKLLDTPSF